MRCRLHAEPDLGVQSVAGQMLASWARRFGKPGVRSEVAPSAMITPSALRPTPEWSVPIALRSCCGAATVTGYYGVRSERGKVIRCGQVPHTVPAMGTVNMAERYFGE